MKTFELPIEDVLDLHLFHPRDIQGLLDEYLILCQKKNIFSLRIIHGKGKGILKKKVYSILDRHPAVSGYEPAPMETGGWGAVIVYLNP